MRVKSTVLLLLILAVPLLLGSGCTGDEGPRGPKGDRGDQGPAGPEGPSGTADCVTCHNDNTLLAAVTLQWEKSLHSSDELLWEINRDPCYQCHTSEGFVSKLAGTPAIETNPTMIGCRTCHAPHTNKNFDLRTTAAYTLQNGVVVDGGKGNLCVNCHRSRRDIRTYVVAEPDSTNISSENWGPHYGTMAEIYFGTGGYEYGEQMSQSSHKSGISDACVGCHMQDPIGTQVGGHTFKISDEELGKDGEIYAKCQDCHAGAETFNLTALADYDGDGSVEGMQDEYDGLLGQLREELLVRELIYPAGHEDADRPIPAKRPAVEAGAIYNFLLVLREGSHGIHIPKYEMDLLQTTLVKLRAFPKRVA